MAIKALKEASEGFIDSNDLDKVGDIIIENSVIAAAAGVGAGWLPGAGSVAATAAWVAAIWTLYLRINKALGIKFKENAVKSIASAMLTNILATGGSIILALAGATVLSFVPGLGTAGAVIIDGLIGYITVFASGVLYIKMLTKLFKAKGDIRSIDDIDKDDINSVVKETVDESDVKNIIKEAKGSFKEAKKSGAIDKQKAEQNKK